MGTSRLARSPGIGCRVRAEVLLVKAQLGTATSTSALCNACQRWARNKKVRAKSRYLIRFIDDNELASAPNRSGSSLGRLQHEAQHLGKAPRISCYSRCVFQ